jgi:acetyltransferase-like isoleucine patch superfamily enzyme
MASPEAWPATEGIDYERRRAAGQRAIDAMGISPTARIFPTARLVHDGTNLSIGDYTQIDDFVFVYAGQRCTIGRFVHLASFTSVIGGGTFSIDDFSGFSAGCRVITGSDDFSGPWLHTPGVPPEFRNVRISHVTIEKSVVVGTNAVIFPSVTIGEGAAIGAGSMVRRDVAPWGVYAGDPLRKVGERDREGILEKRRLVLERLAAGALR